ncbi:Uncharacterised protein [Clostridioides difficile]|uniref:hypothetical protein n=1 Tax=Clostridioides difficile TaxID=1496 RepID=UPI000D1DB950|nr:hypothetical protein [Clostridioides difficile]UWD40705.1 hypothetical protein NYF05_15320 [Clostridioides difficile]UWD44491.1 hypothetical protein NYU56_15080 [Clostridioides difficile]VFF94741.1 Uncharacterised protein [Clostridioides difficile]VIG11174.1 Uncharacterised protein [Clostridioides difficile]HBE9438109.1 hypothetical protein [Clostridioides difficile]
MIKRFNKEWWKQEAKEIGLFVLIGFLGMNSILFYKEKFDNSKVQFSPQTIERTIENKNNAMNVLKELEQGTKSIDDLMNEL